MNASIIATYSLLAGCRVRTSEGKAHALFPRVVGDHIEVALLSNNYGAEWIRLPKGTEVTLLAVVDKTDSYVTAIQLPAGEDGVKPEPRGMILRKAGFEGMIDAAEPTTPAVLAFVHQVAEPEAIEVEAAPAEPEVAVTENAETPAAETTVTEPEPAATTETEQAAAEPVQAAPAETAKPRGKGKNRQADPSVEDLLNS